jgi:ketosteroid isomerase-like protein
MGETRRGVLRGGFAAAAALAAAAPGAGATAAGAEGGTADDASLRTAFDRLSKTLNGGDVDGFLALFHERAVVIDEDSPFRNTKEQFIDHLGFHGAKNWEGFAWVPRDTRLFVRGNTGYTAGTVTFRGKPVDSGFRLRHMMHTIGWSRPAAGADWKIVLFHQAPLYGHLHGTSPGTGN